MKQKKLRQSIDQILAGLTLVCLLFVGLSGPQSKAEQNLPTAVELVEVEESTEDLLPHYYSGNSVLPFGNFWSG